MNNKWSKESFFSRATRQKPTGSMISRTYGTYDYDKLLDGEPEDKVGIESCTFLYVDIENGILAIVGALGAPNEKCFARIFTKYSKEYDVELVPIPNPDGVERVYGKKNSEISEITLNVPIPDPAILSGIFGEKGKQIYDMVTNDNIKAKIQLSSCIRKGKITDDSDNTEKLLDCLKERLPNFSAASIRAKYTGEKTRDYNFYEENFYYPMDINDSRMEGGKRHYFSSDELVVMYNNGVRGAYNISKDFILAVANRLRKE